MRSWIDLVALSARALKTSTTYYCATGTVASTSITSVASRHPLLRYPRRTRGCAPSVVRRQVCLPPQYPPPPLLPPPRPIRPPTPPTLPAPAPPLAPPPKTKVEPRRWYNGGIGQEGHVVESKPRARVEAARALCCKGAIRLLRVNSGSGSHGVRCEGRRRVSRNNPLGLGTRGRISKSIITNTMYEIRDHEGSVVSRASRLLALYLTVCSSFDSHMRALPLYRMRPPFCPTNTATRQRRDFLVTNKTLAPEGLL